MGRPKKQPPENYKIVAINTPIPVKQPFEIVNYAVSVIPSGDDPVPQEPILQTRNAPGGFTYLTNSLEGNPSFFDNTANKDKICKLLIKELDKGEHGYFNTAFFLNCDIITPTLNQYNHFKKVFFANPENKPENFTPESLGAVYSVHQRVYLRTILFRFFSYYRMGYKVEFTEVGRESGIPKSPEPVTEEKAAAVQ